MSILFTTKKMRREMRRMSCGLSSCRRCSMAASSLQGGGAPAGAVSAGGRIVQTSLAACPGALCTACPAKPQAQQASGSAAVLSLHTSLPAPSAGVQPFERMWANLGLLRFWADNRGHRPPALELGVVEQVEQGVHPLQQALHLVPAVGMGAWAQPEWRGRKPRGGASLQRTGCRN